NAFRWRPLVKDANGMLMRGIDIRRWIEVGLRFREFDEMLAWDKSLEEEENRKRQILRKAHQTEYGYAEDAGAGYSVDCIEIEGTPVWRVLDDGLQAVVGAEFDEPAAWLLVEKFQHPLRYV